MSALGKGSEGVVIVRLLGDALADVAAIPGQTDAVTIFALSEVIAPQSYNTTLAV